MCEEFSRISNLVDYSVVMALWFAANERHEVQFDQVRRGSRSPKKRQSGSTGVWLEFVLNVKDVAPSRCATSQHASTDRETFAKPTMCPFRATASSSCVKILFALPRLSLVKDSDRRFRQFQTCFSGQVASAPIHISS